MKRLYMAGSDVFFSFMKELAEEKHDLCRRYGVEGHFPMDNPIDLAKYTDPADGAYAIYRNDIDLLDRCNMLIANLTPFRGVSADPGTVFELGYMTARYPDAVAAYTLSDEVYIDRVRRQGYAGPSGVIDHEGLSIENFGGFDNLMCTGALRRPDGSSRCIIMAGDPNNIGDHLVAFEACLKLLTGLG